MTYSVGQRIRASDYNGFVSNNAANVNGWWSTGSGNAGWGQTAIPNVSTGSKIYASAWASILDVLQTSSNHTGTTITSRTAPVTGDKIRILTGLDTDITNVYTGRGNAITSGSTGSTWTGTASYTSDVTVSNYNWSMTWTSTVTFDSANQARYFFNTGGLVRIDMSKSSTGKTKDTYWNDLVSSIGTLYVSGGAQTISGVSYTGFTRRNGSGSPTTYNTGYGWFYLLSNSGEKIAFQQNQTSGLYTGDYVRISIAATSSNVLTITTNWYSPSLLLSDNSITGGTATNSPFSGFGTAPAVVVRCVSPSSTYLTNSWGTQVVNENVSVVTSPGPTVTYLLVAGGGGGADSILFGGAGGGGAGGLLEGSGMTLLPGVSYPVVVGLGGQSRSSGSSGYNSSMYGGNSTFNGLTAIGGGYGAGNTLYGYVYNGANGGSGGGAAPAYTAGSGTPGQGYSGGVGVVGSSWGGGGGAVSPGGQLFGGSPLSSNITGTFVYYGHGGQGGQANSGGAYGTPGTPNSGNGGGGGGGGIIPGVGGAGGSGIVILSYVSPTQLATGGTVTSYNSVSGLTWVHTFTTNGTFS